MDETLRTLVDLRDRLIQKQRIAFGNRLAAAEKEDNVSEGTIQLLERWHERFDKLEKYLNEDIKRIVKDSDDPILDDMTSIKGIGPILALKIAAMVDISRAPTVSALWRYAGYAVIDGKGERPVKGQKLSYNKRLKIACRLAGESFLKSRSPYADVYYASKEYYKANRQDWTKYHIHNASLRRMIKLFLSHLWLQWRRREGLPISEPYVHARLGHEHNYKPAQFGWPQI